MALNEQELHEGGGIDTEVPLEYNASWNALMGFEEKAM